MNTLTMWRITASGLVLCLWGAGCKTNNPTSGPGTTAKIDQLFAQWNRADAPGAAVVIVKDGAVVYQRGYGSANLETRTPITPQTSFDAASVAKQFTGLA